MQKLARWTMAHRRVVVVAWIVVALGILGISHAAGTRSANTFALPGTGSQQAIDLLQSRFSAQAGDSDQIVFDSRAGTLTAGAQRSTITAMLERVARLPHVAGVISPYTKGAGAISRDGTIGFATVSFDQSAGALTKETVSRVIATAESARSSRLEIELGGQAIENAQRPSPGFATVVGIGAAIVILLLAFGSFVAMTLPLITALIGLAAGLGLIGLASHVIDTATFAPELALMIGLAVGVDYALFIVTRFRESYRENGGDVPLAIETALGSAGRAVLFAGITVVVAILGMFALGVSLLDGVAVAGALGVVMVLAASLTLLPALLSLTGRRIGEGNRRARRRSAARATAASSAAEAAADAGAPRFWLGWVGRVQRHPAITATAATAVMLALASPALGLHLGTSDAGTDATSQTTRQAYDLLAQGFGPGFNGPLEVAVALPQVGDEAAVTQISHALATTPGIVSVTPARVSPTRTAAAIVAYPTTSPQSPQTADLVSRLRTSVLPPVERATTARAYVGGATASQVDFAHVLASKLLVFVAVVVLLGALLLMIVFRSVAIPVKAAAMNLLSIGASLGITQAVFERGWAAGMLGVQKGTVDVFIPVLAFAIIFGLSTDYEVFLVSRIHEEWHTRHDASAAIRGGFARTARVVTAAAAVMVCVFGAFAISGQRALAEFGIELGSAVLLDALVIRMLLLPAVLQILGSTAWTLPGWLGRVLPTLSIETAATPPRRRTAEPALEGEL